MEEIPVRKLVFNEVEGQSGVKTIAFVDMPAIMVNWIAFAAEPVKFAVLQDEKRMILSPALIPDLPIIRTDKTTGKPFAVTMDKDTIAEVALRWAKEGRQNFANEMHDPSKPIEGVTWFSQFIADGEHILNPPAFESLPDGTLYYVGKIDNDAIWSDVKSGKYKGISIDGFFDMIETHSLTAEQIDATTESILKQVA